MILEKIIELLNGVENPDSPLKKFLIDFLHGFLSGIRLGLQIDDDLSDFELRPLFNKIAKNLTLFQLESPLTNSNPIEFLNNVKLEDMNGRKRAQIILQSTPSEQLAKNFDLNLLALDKNLKGMTEIFQKSIESSIQVFELVSKNYSKNYKEWLEKESITISSYVEIVLFKTLSANQGLIIHLFEIYEKNVNEFLEIQENLQKDHNSQIELVQSIGNLFSENPDFKFLPYTKLLENAYNKDNKGFIALLSSYLSNSDPNKKKEYLKPTFQTLMNANLIKPDIDKLNQPMLENGFFFGSELYKFISTTSSAAELTRRLIESNPMQIQIELKTLLEHIKDRYEDLRYPFGFLAGVFDIHEGKLSSDMMNYFSKKADIYGGLWKHRKELRGRNNFSKSQKSSLLSYFDKYQQYNSAKTFITSFIEEAHQVRIHVSHHNNDIEQDLLDSKQIKIDDPSQSEGYRIFTFEEIETILYKILSFERIWAFQINIFILKPDIFKEINKIISEKKK